MRWRLWRPSSETKATLGQSSIMLVLGVLSFLFIWFLWGNISHRLIIALVWSDLMMTKWIMKYPTARERAIREAMALIKQWMERPSEVKLMCAGEDLRIGEFVVIVPHTNTVVRPRHSCVPGAGTDAPVPRGTPPTRRRGDRA